MDNLTHSLVGALLSQAGLKKLTGRATATLVIAANLPDIDAFATLLGTESLAIRRGFTHGPIALLVLPPILWGIMLAYDRWRPAKQVVRPWPLLALAYIGTLTHPALDWLNSYGIRLLEPFSSRWYAADTLFIVDVWVWLILAGSLALSILRSRRGSRRWFVPARYGFGLVLAYIGVNAMITAQAEEQATRLAKWQYRVEPTLVVANPVPINFWRRDLLWRSEDKFGRGYYGFIRGPRLRGKARDIGLDDPAFAAAKGRGDVDAFLFWSRMPFVEHEDGRVWLRDQRFDSELTRSRFRVDLGEEKLPTR